MRDDAQEGGRLWLWRSSMESEIWRRGPVLWQVWSWCMMRANWRPVVVDVTVGLSAIAVQLDRGQFISGRKSAAAELSRIPESTIRRSLQILERLGSVTVKAAHHYSIITICNYDIYQPKQIESGAQVARQRRTSGAAAATDKELKEGEELKEDSFATQTSARADSGIDDPPAAKRRKPASAVYPESFEAFWRAYPRREGKKTAFESYKRAGAILVARGASREAARDLLLTKCQEFAASPKGKAGRFCPCPAPWLNQGRYDDDPAAWRLDDEPEKPDLRPYRPINFGAEA